MNEIIKGEIGELPYEIITRADILTEQDTDDLKELLPELKQTFLRSQVFRTRTEMEVSVLNDIKHPTPASKYWQSVREQNVMFTELVMLSYEYRKNNIEIKMLEKELASGQSKETGKLLDELDRELLHIAIERKTFSARTHERAAKDRIRELRQWSQIMEREAGQMTAEELSGVDNHQLISYTKRWIKQASVLAENASQGEKQNLLGQLQSGIKECKRIGVLPQVFHGLSIESPLVKELAEQNNLLLA